MREITGNIWDYHIDSWVVITTNGTIKKNGCAVMGRGVAAQCATKFPQMPLMLGNKLKHFGNNVHVFKVYNLITLPVKYHWSERADIKLIEQGITQLKDICRYWESKIYLPRPGCGNGQLLWENVKPLVEKLNNKFTVVNLI